MFWLHLWRKQSRDSQQSWVALQVPCHQGCSERYCSAECAREAWNTYHCLLCCGSSHPPDAADPGGSGSGDVRATLSAAAAGGVGGGGDGGGSNHVGGGSSSSEPSSSALLQCAALGVTVDAQAMQRFAQHADKTNDIFHVAARVMATSLVQYLVLLAQQRGQQADDSSHDAQLTPALPDTSSPSPVQTARTAAGSCTDQSPTSTCRSGAVVAAAVVAAAYEAWSRRGPGGSQHDYEESESCSDDPDAASRRALVQAWAPFQLGWKRLWWECVALPEDVEDEEDFRKDIK